jgi:hypothetical protein
MPADPTQPYLFRGGDGPVLVDFIGPERFPCIGICKYPAFNVRWRSISSLMLTYLFRQGTVEWHPSLGSRRLYSSGESIHIRLAYAHSHAFPIDITPFQAEYFANPESHAHGNNAHRSKWFGDVLQHLPELIYRESSGLPLPFRAVLYANEAHGIELIRDQFPAHRGVKQDVHQILEMRLAFRRKGESEHAAAAWAVAGVIAKILAYGLASFVSVGVAAVEVSH